MGILMPETCWNSVDNKHLIVASCWFSLSLHNLLTIHGHKNLKFRNTVSVPSSWAGGYEEWLGLRMLGCLHSLFLYSNRPYPVTLIPIGSGNFRAKPFPVQTPQHSQPQSFFIPTRLWRWNRHCVPKRWNTKFRRRGITQKKTYSIISSGF